MEAYKIVLKIELDYHNTITFEGTDLALLASLVTLSQTKLSKVKETK